MRPVVYVDLRYLQDYPVRLRGIGQHLTALLRTREQSAFANCRTIGLIDTRSPELPERWASLVDEVSASLNPCCNGDPAIFIDGTPMTHETRFGVRFLGHPKFLTAAVVYDFIPLDWPGYLPSVHSRADYFARIARLRAFDWFFPISEYTAARTSELLGVSPKRIEVTGASVRKSLYEIRAGLGNLPSVYQGNSPYFFMVVGPDERKNPEVAVKAIRHLNLLYSTRIGLKIAGHWLRSEEEALRRVAGSSDGHGFLEFCPDVSDEELANLFAQAIATIVPSHIEGFSLPVVEAAVCGCPAIASTCAAHLELIEQPEALFPSNDPAVLAEKLEALLNDPSLRASLVLSQEHLAAKFHEDAVGRRFWNALETASNRRSCVCTRAQKRRYAFLSPYPPEQLDAAFCTAMTMKSGGRLFQSDLYTDSPRPLTFDGMFQEAGAVGLAPLLSGRYDGVISVLGNSVRFKSIYRFFDRYGGPCILHDTWRPADQTAFLPLERVVQCASPLIVHTPTQQALLQKLYNVKAQLTTTCPNHFFKHEDLSLPSREAARERLGIPPGVFAVSSFGSPARPLGMDTCILSVELLRSWNIPAELYFVNNSSYETAEINHIASLYDVSDYVHCGSRLQSPEAYRDFLLASDAAIQVRNYSFGAGSTGLSNCVSAGLPCVATYDMSQSCEAPAFALTVPDYFSYLHVAEQLALIYEAGTDRTIHEEARAAYLAKHNFSQYAERLAAILEMA